jgi:hypothetical protein
MNNSTNLVSIICVIVMVACAPPPVKVESFSPGVNPKALTAFKTFDFYKLHVTGDAGPYFETNLEACKKAVASQMISRGFTEVATGGELAINIGVMLHVKNQPGASTQMRYMSEPNYTWHNKLKTQKNREGTITVEMVDTSKKSGVWIGVFSGAAPKEEEGKLKNIDEGVALLFEKFPVRAGRR